VQTEGSTEKLIYYQAKHKRWKFDAANSEDIRFTRKGSNLFAIALGWPEDGKLRIKTLKKGGPVQVAGVSLLGSSATLNWRQTADALEVQLPAEKPCKHAYALKLAAKGTLD
jgi:alpha-L-fucosidase